MEGIGDEIYDLGIAELAKREGEVRAFDRSVKVAQKAAQDKGIAEVRKVTLRVQGGPSAEIVGMG